MTAARLRLVAATCVLGFATSRAAWSAPEDPVKPAPAAPAQPGSVYKNPGMGLTVEGPPERVADVLAQWPEAIYVVITAGRFDVLVELVSRDRRDLLEMINRVRMLEGVSTTETFVYLDLVKQLFDWGAAPVGETAST